MKNRLFVFTLLLLAGVSFGQKKISQLTALTTPKDATLFLVTYDSSGTNVSRKMTLADLLAEIIDGTTLSLDTSGDPDVIRINPTGDFTADDITCTTISGNGSGLTGITGATGGVSNDGSTTIEADANGDATGDVALQINGTTHIHLDNSGKTGYGDADPDAMVEIAETGTDPFYVSNGTSGDGDLFNVQSDGKVGVGTASPSNILQTNVSGNAVGFEWGDGTYRGQLYKDTATGFLGVGSLSNHDLRLFTDNTSTRGMIIKSSNGRVGVGLTTPSTILQTYVAGDAMGFEWGDGTYRGALYKDTSTGYLGVATVSSHDLRLFVDNTSDRGVIIESSTGNVGIGTATFDGTAVGVMTIANGTAPAAGTANQSYIYAKDDGASSEMHVMDEAGNETKISPHNADGEWEFYSRNKITGKTVRINMEKFIKRMEEITGESFMEVTYEKPEVKQ